MAETATAPDFDQIARRLHNISGAYTSTPRSIPEQEIVDALRQVWNARGAADANALNWELGQHYGEPGYSAAEAINREIRKLDR